MQMLELQKKISQEHKEIRELERERRQAEKEAEREKEGSLKGKRPKKKRSGWFVRWRDIGNSEQKRKNLP